jgi:hypothetical protein
LYFASSEASMICTLTSQVLKYSTLAVNISLHQPDLWQRENASECMNFVSKGKLSSFDNIKLLELEVKCRQCEGKYINECLPAIGQYFCKGTVEKNP